MGQWRHGLARKHWKSEAGVANLKIDIETGLPEIRLHRLHFALLECFVVFPDNYGAHCSA